MSRVVFDPDARTEFLDTVKYYEACEKGLGERFRQAVENETANIELMPFRYRVLHTHFHRCLIPNFPYSIIFSIERDCIMIMAVAHNRRKPGYWTKRKE